jgi:hypothetical protein
LREQRGSTSFEIVPFLVIRLGRPNPVMPIRVSLGKSFVPKLARFTHGTRAGLSFTCGAVQPAELVSAVAHTRVPNFG